MHAEEIGLALDFRRMQAQDLEAVLAIENEEPFPWSKKMLQDCLAMPYKNLVLTDAGKVIGFAILSIVLDECELLNIAITTSRRRQGLGRLLLQRVLDIAKQREVHCCYLEVRESNTVAQKLYQQLGFQVMNIRKEYYPAQTGRENAVVLSCELR